MAQAREAFTTRAAAGSAAPAAWYPDRYVFLLSHMRSYSTVLSHVLGSSPEIAGYTESHVKYRRHSDLIRLRWRVGRALRRWPTGRYLLDKQLYNALQLPRQLAQLRGFRALIFIREPASTLASIRGLADKEGAVAWYRDWDAIARYYCSRAHALVAHGVALGPRALAFRAESIVDDTPRLLGAIESHLGLAAPLSMQYELRPFTGRGGHGDPGQWIHAGRIVRARGAAPPPEPIPEAALERCRAAHEQCWRQLRDWCPSHASVLQ